MDSFGVLIERDAELAAFGVALEELSGEAGGLIILEGAAGIGKTRLLEQFAGEARETGARVRTARVTELERSLSMGLVQQLFEPLIRQAGESERKRWLAGAAQQATAVIDVMPGQDVAFSGGGGDFAVLHGLYWLTANISQDCPLLLLIDDVHWADPASLRFLAFLLPRLQELAVLVVIAMRPDEPGAESEMLSRLASHRVSRILRPKPLSRAGSARMLQSRLNSTVDFSFLDACHTAAKGNPLLLESLASTVDEGLAPVAENASLVARLGARAVTHFVKLRLSRLPVDAAQLAQAIAVLGADADLANAATLARMTPMAAAAMVDALRRIDLLLPAETHELGPAPRLQFVHPLVRSAVYDLIDAEQLITMHKQTAELLTVQGVSSVQIATHLLPLPAAGDQKIVLLLRQAADEAIQRGSAESAHLYLQRALQEPPDKEALLQTLIEAGAAAMQVDLPAAADHLSRVLELTTDPWERARIAVKLSMALHYLSRTAESVIVAQQARDALPPDDDDLRRLLNSNLLCFPPTATQGRHLSESLSELIELPHADTHGARALEAMIAGMEGYGGDPAAIEHARSALAYGTLRVSEAQAVATGAWLTLVTADHDQEGMAAMDRAVDQARRTGSLSALPIASLYRVPTWIWRGQLAEAEAVARDVLRLMDLTSHDMARFVAVSLLIEILTEQGRLDEAAEVVREAKAEDQPPTGLLFWYHEFRAHLLRVQGDHENALEAALAAGESFAANGGVNPAFVAWRSEAALNLKALGRVDEAVALAEEELRLARRWGAPRALGHALRVRGLVSGVPAIELLREAVRLLAPSFARLEYAKALVDLGSTLRRTGQHAEARELLGEARAIAENCGAVPLREQAGIELAASGGRPRRTQITGPDSLTPSERRVVELAIAGSNNREIAEALFVTAKTIEAHLTSAYRKLDVTSRNQLARAFQAPPERPR